MIQITSGSLEDLKLEMAEHKRLAQAEIKSIRDKYKPLKGKLTREARDKLQNLEVKNSIMYSHTKTMPVKIGPIMVNYKLLQQFMKKLKGFEVKETLHDRTLQLEYHKIGSTQCGMLSLQDISHYYEGFKCIPVAEFERHG